jgi:hypothetical protein
MAVKEASTTAEGSGGRKVSSSRPGRASAESHPGDPAEQAEQAEQAYRRWVRALLTDLAAHAGVPEPEVLARQLAGVVVGQSGRADLALARRCDDELGSGVERNPRRPADDQVGTFPTSGRFAYLTAAHHKIESRVP